MLREVEIEPNVKLERVSKFCYLGDMLGVGGVEEAVRAKVRFAWAEFKFNLLSHSDGYSIFEGDFVIKVLTFFAIIAGLEPGH